jgi:hypothetical protein
MQVKWGTMWVAQIRLTGEWSTLAGGLDERSKSYEFGISTMLQTCKDTDPEISCAAWIRTPQAYNMHIHWRWLGWPRPMVPWSREVCLNCLSDGYVLLKAAAAARSAPIISLKRLPRSWKLFCRWEEHMKLPSIVSAYGVTSNCFCFIWPVLMMFCIGENPDRSSLAPRPWTARWSMYCRPLHNSPQVYDVSVRTGNKQRAIQLGLAHSTLDLMFVYILGRVVHWTLLRRK